MVALLASPSVSLGNDTTICPPRFAPAPRPSRDVVHRLEHGCSANPVDQAHAAGTYRITITAANGCTDADTMVLGHFALPVVNLGPDTMLCPGRASSWMLATQVAATSGTQDRPRRPSRHPLRASSAWA
ncbi:MAG: hypothetical protein U0176_03620 [Bacteroidia bacterium]